MNIDKMSYHSPFFFIVSAMIASLAFTPVHVADKAVSRGTPMQAGLLQKLFRLEGSGKSSLRTTKREKPNEN